MYYILEDISYVYSYPVNSSINKVYVCNYVCKQKIGMLHSSTDIYVPTNHSKSLKTLELQCFLKFNFFSFTGKGDTFGENFGENTSRPTGNSHASVRALTYCDLHSIRKEDLLYILRLYPRFTSSFNNDLEITYNLRHEVKVRIHCVSALLCFVLFEQPPCRVIGPNYLLSSDLNQFVNVFASCICVF